MVWQQLLLCTLLSGPLSPSALRLTPSPPPPRPRSNRAPAQLIRTAETRVTTLKETLEAQQADLKAAQVGRHGTQAPAAATCVAVLTRRAASGGYRLRCIKAANQKQLEEPEPVPSGSIISVLCQPERGNHPRPCAFPFLVFVPAGACGGGAGRVRQGPRIAARRLLRAAEPVLACAEQREGCQR